MIVRSNDMVNFRALNYTPDTMLYFGGIQFWNLGSYDIIYDIYVGF